jgi:predicted dehydrogenase
VSDLRVAIAGFGLAGEVFHAPLVAAVDGLEVSAVLTRSPERAAKAQAGYPGVRVVDSIDALVEDIDLLVVATPNSSHVDVALAGVAADLPVVVDKPVAPSAAEARRLLAAGGRVTVFQNRRYDSDFQTIWRMLDEDRLGRVFRFESRFERFRPEVNADAWRELPDEAEGGGLLLDLGAHLVDQARQLFDDPLAVYAEIHARRPGAQVDDDVFVALEHPHGVRSHLWMSATAPLHGPRFRVSGLRAGFACDGLDPQEPQLAEGIRPGDPGYGIGPAGRLEPGGEVVTPERGAYDFLYERIRDWARGQAPAPVDPADSLRVLEILEAARRSAETREVVQLEG